MTITLSGLPPIPLHPLDLTTPSTNDPTGHMCTGLIQQNTALGTDSDGDAASNGAGFSNTIGTVDIVLGVPFLRNLYTVLALEEPSPDGSFNPASGLNTNNLNPYIGFLPLTSPAQALDEFHTVRVLHQSLGPSSSSSSSPSTDTNSAAVGGKKVSAGLCVLFALLAFFVFCALLFLGWWIYMRRRLRKDEKIGATGGDVKIDELKNGKKDEEGEELPVWSMRSIARKDSAAFSDDTLRNSGEIAFDSLKAKRET